MEFSTADNETIETITSDITKSLTGCIHTATLAVCTVLVIFVLFLGCAGNGVVLFNALTTKKHRHMCDLFVINLAGADFISCTCLSPMFIFLLFSDSDIPKVFCASILFLGVTSGLLSLLTLVTIAIHRRCRVVGLLRKSLSLLKVSVVVGIIWLISLSFATACTVHIILTWNEQTINECQNVIDNPSSKGSNFVLYYLSPVIIASLVIIGTCYGTIARAATGQRHYGHIVSPERGVECEPGVKCDGSETGNQQFVTPTTDKCASPVRDSRADNGNKALIMCVVVTLTVSLCWGPLIMSEFVEMFSGASIILYQVKLCGIALIFLNSALNPYLYGQNNSKIKHRYIRMLYNFARCEYSFPVRNLGNARSDLNPFERCPLQGSPPTQDTVTGHCYCPNCESCTDCWSSEALHARQYFTNFQYAQNLLLVTSHGAFSSNLV